MKVKLSEIPTYLLTVKEYAARLEAFKQHVGSRFSYTVFFGEYRPERERGFSISLLKLLKVVPIPVLILEDDCCLTEYYQNEIEVPDDADAIYLGTSSWGVKDGISKRNNLVLHPYNKDYYRISCMTSTHAVLYLGETYLAHLRKVGESYREDGEPTSFDWMIALEQEKFKVYGASNPFFYQNTPGNDEVTKFSLNQVYAEL
jgi:hypothetical protein